MAGAVGKDAAVAQGESGVGCKEVVGSFVRTSEKAGERPYEDAAGKAGSGPSG